MRRRINGFIAILGLIILLPPVVPDLGASSVVGLTPHAPIRINGDGGFTGQNGVVSGSGTDSDPYVVEGWEIGSAAIGIAITNTRTHFVVRNVWVHDASEGVSFRNVRNGRIDDSLMSSVVFGIRLLDSSENVFGRNNITRSTNGVDIVGGSANIVENNFLSYICFSGIQVASPNSIVRNNMISFLGTPSGCVAYGITIGSSGNSIVGNLVFENNYLGIYLVGADRNLVLNNTLVRNPVGILIVDSRNVSVEDNRISEGGTGIEIIFGSNHTIRGNWILENWRYGIVLLVTSRHVVEQNIVDGSRTGMWLQRAVYNTITGNSMTNNQVGIFFCLEFYGNRLAPPVNDFSGTQHPILHCNYGYGTLQAGGSARMS